MKKVILYVVLISISPHSVVAENVNPSAEFDGLWQVIPTPPPFGRRQGMRDREGRQLGFDADEQGLTRADQMVRSIMTDEGRNEFDKFDPLKLPANNCLSPGLPSIVMTPYLQLWSYDDGTLSITHEYFSTERKIYFDSPREANQPSSASGFAAALFEGEDLVITTKAFTPVWGGLSRNAPSSDARIVIERYRLSTDKQMIEGQLTIKDEKFLTRDLNLSVRLRRAEPGTELVLFPCDLDATRRHLD